MRRGTRARVHAALQGAQCLRGGRETVPMFLRMDGVGMRPAHPLHSGNEFRR